MTVNGITWFAGFLGQDEGRTIRDPGPLRQSRAAPLTSRRVKRLTPVRPRRANGLRVPVLKGLSEAPLFNGPDRA